MKVLVTGNEGMIGSVVEKVLCADGCEVIGFDIASGHNILNPNEIRSALQGCDAVVHLAALLGNSEDVPDEIMAVNLLGTWHILSAAAEAARSALYCPNPGHVTLLLCADDISSANRTSQEMAQSLLPEVDWRGGDEYEHEPYKALINTQLAKEVLQWVPRYKWRQ